MYVVISRPPSAVYAAWRTLSGAVKASRGVEEDADGPAPSRSKMRTVFSYPPVTRDRPSGPNATVRTMWACGRVASSSPEMASHRRAEKSAEAVAARRAGGSRTHSQTAPWRLRDQERVCVSAWVCGGITAYCPSPPLHVAWQPQDTGAQSAGGGGASQGARKAAHAGRSVLFSPPQ